jgi:ubiquitin-activating enzyme E1
LNIEEFEKDDDRNNHIDFVAAAANLRALNYRIDTETRLEIKRIAGKIIPAIATTTSMVVGFVCLEMYKIHSIVKRPIGDFRGGAINLAISMFALQEPIAAPQAKIAGDGPTFLPLWDTIAIDGDPTLQEFFDGITQKWGVNIGGVSCGRMSLFTAGRGPAFEAKKKQRMPMKITAIVEQLGKQPIPAYTQFLKVDVTASKDKKSVELPVYVINFRK